MINVAANDLQLVKEILRRHIPGFEVRAFGSRVDGQTKPYSDLDLVIMSKKEVDQGILTKLKDDFAESNLSFRVDVLDWHRVAPEFRMAIEKKNEVLRF